MNTVKFNKRNTKIIAHRGVSGIECENTCASFVYAGSRSYMGIETDIHKTSDGVFVVFHDDETGRIGDKNISVDNSIYSELLTVNLRGKDGNFRSDYKIPKLEDYISICKLYEKTAFLEIKSPFDYKDLYEAVEIIDKMGYLENTIFISFHLDVLINLRKICPSQKAQYLVLEYSSEIFEVLKKYKLDIDIKYTALTEEIIDFLHKNNIKVNAWTVDNKCDGERLASWGIDYLTSNILE